MMMTLSRLLLLLPQVPAFIDLPANTGALLVKVVMPASLDAASEGGLFSGLIPDSRCEAAAASLVPCGLEATRCRWQLQAPFMTAMCPRPSAARAGAIHSLHGSYCAQAGAPMPGAQLRGRCSFVTLTCLLEQL